MKYDQFLTRYAPWDHQKVAIDHVWWHLNNSRSVYLRADMGAGKTKIVIDIVNNFEGIRNILVVCPHKAMLVWEYEMKKHDITEKYPYATPINMVILKDKKKEKKLRKLRDIDFNNGINIVVINYRSVSKLSLDSRIWDLIVADEVHSLSTHDTVQTKFMAKMHDRARYRIGMTGTPVGGKYEHIFGQFRFVDANSFGRNYYSFAYKFCIYGGYKNHEIVGYKNVAHLNYIYRKKVVDIEVDHNIPTRHVNIPLRLEDSISKQLYKEQVELLKDAIAKNDEMKVRACVTRMQQITSGYIKIKGEIKQVNTYKIDALNEMISGINEHIVVFYWFREDMRRIQALVQKHYSEKFTLFKINGDTNEYMEFKNYNGELHKLVAVQIQSGSMSLDLTDARRAIYYSNTHRFYDYTQSLARLERPGQDEDLGVIYYHLMIEKTVDVSIRKSNNRKDDIMQALIRGEFLE